eukprot:jgi/Bigna1/129923/aug1.10_g4631
MKANTNQRTLRSANNGKKRRLKQKTINEKNKINPKTATQPPNLMHMNECKDQKSIFQDVDDIVFAFATSASKTMRSLFEMLSQVSNFGTITFTDTSVHLACRTSSVIVSVELCAKSSIDIEEYLFNPHALYSQHTPGYINIASVTGADGLKFVSNSKDSNSILPAGDEKTKNIGAFTYSVSFSTVHQCLSMMTHGDIFMMKINKDLSKQQKLELRVQDKEMRRMHSFSIPCTHDSYMESMMHVGESKNDTNIANLNSSDHLWQMHVKDKEFKMGIHMSSVQFLKMMRSVKKNGTSLQMITTKNRDLRKYCHFCVAGEGIGVDCVSSHEFVMEDEMQSFSSVNKGRESEPVLAANCGSMTIDTEKISSETPEILCQGAACYSVNLLLNFAKCTSLTSVVHLYYNDVKKDVLGFRHMTGTIGELTCFISPMDVEPAFKAVRSNNNYIPKVKVSGSDVKSSKNVMDRSEDDACSMFKTPDLRHNGETDENETNRSNATDPKNIQECNDLTDVLNLDLNIDI